jgi:hypothetical protein
MICVASLKSSPKEKTLSPSPLERGWGEANILVFNHFISCFLRGNYFALLQVINSA